MQKIVCIAFLMLCTYHSKSCDVCACAASGSQLGILPQFSRHFMGVKYQYSSYDSKPHNAVESSTLTRETFHTTQLWTRIVAHRRIHFFAFLPYKVNIRNTENATVKVNGIGDAMLLTNVILFNTDQNSTQKLKQALQVGGGLKLPTGKSDKIINGLMLHSNMQTGTGSFDIPLNLIYTLRYQSFGGNAEINFTKNGINKQHFQFGNRTTASMRFFAWKEIKKISLLPNLGATYENSSMDKQQSHIQAFTGGSNLQGNIGLDIYYSKFGLNLLFQAPLYQKMGDGNITGHPRLMGNIIYLF